MTKRYEVVIGRGAADDLDAIAAYVADKGGADAAVRLIDELTERIEALERFPHRGAEPKELHGANRHGHRQLVHGNYRIFYFVRDNRVVVTLVADGRRDMETLLRHRLLAPDLAD